MDFKEYEKALPVLQNSICSRIVLNDAAIDIIEAGFSTTGDAVSCPSHTHTWFEFNYIISESMYTCFGGDMQEVGEDMFFIIPPGMEHSHKYNNKKPHTDFFFRWQIIKEGEGKAGYDDSCFKQLEPLFFWDLGCCKDDGLIGGLLKHMLEQARDGAAPVKLKLDFINFLFALSRLKAFSNGGEIRYSCKYARDMEAKAIIKKVEVYLNDRNLENFDVHKLAASLHMSYGHLARQYKKYSGQTIFERLNSIRVEKSCLMLAQTGYSIKEIAAKLGFSSQYYFSKVFRGKNGMSPSEYRVKASS